MKIEKYFFSDSHENPVFLEDGIKPIFVCGLVFGKPGFKDGASIRTSDIKEMGKESVTTGSGSVYELGEMNPDYVEMLAAKAAKIPVITGWSLEKRDFMDRVPGSLEEYKGTKTHAGFFLSGETTDGEYIGGEIIHQEENYVTMLTPDPKSVFRLIETRCFVCWRNLSLETEAFIELTGKVAGLAYDDFGDAFLMKCRPKIPT